MSVCLRNFCLGVNPYKRQYTLPNGSTIVEMPGDRVVYTIKLVNKYRDRRAEARLFVDGVSQHGAIILDPGQTIELERPLNSRQRYTFVAADSAPPSTGIRPGDSNNGLIRCIFTPELLLLPYQQQQPPVNYAESLAPQRMALSKRVYATPGGLREGGTALSGYSGQQFQRVAPVVGDTSLSVTIILRLAAPPSNYFGSGTLQPLPGRMPLPYGTPYPPPLGYSGPSARTV